MDFNRVRVRGFERRPKTSDTQKTANRVIVIRHGLRQACNPTEDRVVGQFEMAASMSGATLRILHLRHRYGNRSRDRIGGGSESLTPLNIISLLLAV